jgi:hypothetical protein
MKGKGDKKGPLAKGPKKGVKEGSRTLKKKAIPRKGGATV